MTPSGMGELKRDQALAVATAFLALFSVVGIALYGLPRFYPFYVEELGWTRQQVTSGNAYSKIFVALAFGFIAGRIVDAAGPRRVMLVGIVMAGGALVGLSYAMTLPVFYLCYAFNALGYVCGGPLPNQVLLSRWFDRARGKAMGVAYLGIGLGGTIVPLLAFSLTQSLGWRGALRVLGVLMIVIAFPVAYFVREPASAVPRSSTAPLALGTVMTKPAFYFLMIGSMASIGAVGGTMQNLALYLRLDRQLPQVSIDTTLSLILLGSIVGRLVMGWLADRWPKKRVMLLIYTIVALAIPPLFYAPTPGVLQVCAFVFGIGLGGDYMIIPLMAAEMYGVAIMGRVMGVVLTADSVSEAVVPMIVAGLRDRSGSYTTGFSLLLVLAAIGALAVTMLPGRPRVEREGSPARTP